MGSRTAILLISLVILIQSGNFLHAQTQKPRLAVKTFENPANYSNSTIGNGLTEILITELSKTGKFRLLEREAVGEMMGEINFGNSEWAKGSTFPVKGQFSGAEYFLFGKVTNFSYSEQAFQTARADYTGTHQVTVYNQRADVRVDFRVARSSTGEIVLAESGAAARQNQSYSSEMAMWFRCLQSQSFITGEFSNSLIGRATMDAIRDVVRKLNDLSSELPPTPEAETVNPILETLAQAEGKILAAISSTEFVVTLGSNNGLKKGDELTVYKEILTKNKRGEVIYKERKEVAPLEVIDVSVTGDRSKVRLKGPLQTVKPELLPQEGNIVRVNIEVARALRGGSTPTKKAGEEELPKHPADNKSQVEDLMKRGNRYLEDGYYAQALDQFQKADGLSPNNASILDALASAHLFLKDFFEAETTSEKMLDLGFPVEVPVGHMHTLGSCKGNIKIEKGRLSFSGDKADHNFALSKQDLRSYPDAKCGFGSSVLCLQIVFRGSDGKEKKFNFLPLVFVRLDGGHVSGGEGSAEDTLKFDRLIDRLIKKYVISSP